MRRWSWIKTLVLVFFGVMIWLVYDAASSSPGPSTAPRLCGCTTPVVCLRHKSPCAYANKFLDAV